MFTNLDIVWGPHFVCVLRTKLGVGDQGWGIFGIHKGHSRISSTWIGIDHAYFIVPWWCLNVARVGISWHHMTDITVMDISWDISVKSTWECFMIHLEARERFRKKPGLVNFHRKRTGKIQKMLWIHGKTHDFFQNGPWLPFVRFL